MKRILLLIVPAALLLTSCQDRRFQTYMANVPVYMSYDELRSSVNAEEGRDLQEPGKIYFKDQFMYINEYREGIHVVDLSDPSAPVQKAFINIPGNVDMAIRNNILYADSFTDLVLIDISDPQHPSEITRVEDLFEYLIPPYDTEYPLDEIDQEKGVILRFKVQEITREVYSNPTPWPIYYDYVTLDSPFSNIRYSSSAGASGNTYGVGGSMARFITYDDYLYTLESTYKLKSIDLSDPAHPVLKNEQYLWGNIETIFISGAYMYVGSSNGMHILSLEEPSVPILLSTYQHITSCDPVVVDGNIAYVTLRAGNICGGNQNLLEVIDISNRNDPERMVSYAMTEPYGLGIDGQTLFICEGEHGLVVFDATDPYAITSHQIAQFGNIHALDVIPLSSFLFMIGEDGFYIYDYSDLNNISLLSHIPVVDVDEG
ncbi:MAG: LVIVD repeat-containing protein [Bacteroidales bacterium]